MPNSNIQINPENWIRDCDIMYLTTGDKVHLQQKLEIQRILVEAHIEELKLEIETLKGKRSEQYGRE